MDATQRLYERKFDPAQPRDGHGQWSGLSGKALETLTRKFGKILEASQWGDHDDKGMHGWASLHEDGFAVLSHRTADGDAEAFLDSNGPDTPGDWRQLGEDLRSAADAAEARDEDFEPISAVGYDIDIDATDGTVSFDSDSYRKAGFTGEPAEMRALAGAADKTAGHLQQHNDGHYDEPDDDDEPDDETIEAKPDSLQLGGEYGPTIDWSRRLPGGGHAFEVTDDDGDTVQPYLSAEEFAGLHAALAAKLNGVGSDQYLPGGDDEDERYFDWSRTKVRDGKTYTVVDIADEDGDVARLEMTEQDMRDWLAALTATLHSAESPTAAARSTDLDKLGARALGALAGATPHTDSKGVRSMDAMTHAVVPSLGDAVDYERMLRELLAGCTDDEVHELGGLADEALDEIYGSSAPRSRLSNLSAALARKGVRDPDALAAHIGRKKYGRKAFKAMAAAGSRSTGLALEELVLRADVELGDDALAESTDWAAAMQAAAAAVDAELGDDIYATDRRDFDPGQRRDDHGRWSRISAALHAIAEAAKVPVIGHETFGGDEGQSHSHGIIAAHPGGDFTLALHDKDAGTSPVMNIPDEDAREDLRAGFDDVLSAHNKDPNASGSIEAEDGSWQIQYNNHGVTLYTNLDDDAPLEEVHLSHADVETIESALGDIGHRSDEVDSPDFTKPLGPDESLRGRKREFADGMGDKSAAVAVVDTPAGPRVRLGAIFAGDGGIKHWTGGRGHTTVDLDQQHAAQVADVLERFDAAQKARQKTYDAIVKEAEQAENDGEDIDWEDVSDQVQDAVGGDFEQDFGEEKIDTPWGTIRLTDVGMDDEANAHDRHVRMEIWPAAMSEDEYDTGNPDYADWAWPGTQSEKPAADLLPKDTRALVKLLRSTFSGPGNAGAEPRALPVDALTTRALGALAGVTPAAAPVPGPTPTPWELSTSSPQERQFTEAVHPRAPVGAGNGGQFAKKSTTAQPAKTTAAQPAKKTATTGGKGAGKVVIPKGAMGYDPSTNRGTGYGTKGGDKRVHELQRLLNHLGFTDRRGKELADDGKLGPLTTSAVKKAQKALGLKQDGIVTPDLLHKMAGMKPQPGATARRRRAKAKADAVKKARDDADTAAAKHHTPAKKTTAPKAAPAHKPRTAKKTTAAKPSPADRPSTATKTTAPRKAPPRSRVGRVDYTDPAGRAADPAGPHTGPHTAAARGPHPNGRRSSTLELCTRAFDFEFDGPGRKGDGRTLEGYAAIFNAPTRIRDMQGDFDEQILPGAFARSIARRMPVMQFDHGKDPAVGAAPIGKITDLAEDGKGLHVRARLFADQSISRVREAIAEQAITGMSFRFGVPQGGDEWRRRGGDVDLREIRDTDVHELGPVVFPAYDATSVSVRSLLSGLDAAQMRELLHELRDLLGGDLAAALADVRASGGVIPAGSATAWVGERGPEPFVFPPGRRSPLLDSAAGILGATTTVHIGRSASTTTDLAGRSRAWSADGGDNGTPPGRGDRVPQHQHHKSAIPPSPQERASLALDERALHALGVL